MHSDGGDVVFRGGESAEIIVCMQQGQTIAALVDVMILVRTLSDHSSVQMPTEQRAIWMGEECEPCLAWYCSDEAGSIVVIRQ